ncbi:MAG: hypothetical protein LBL15_02085, partial [Oscillospiraceae bacterium]|nr:hypothetical protein [Oscillospiraceae bacterium]
MFTEKKPGKKTLSFLLALIMAAGLLPGGLIAPLTAHAAGTEYHVRNWNPYNASGNPDGYPATLSDGDIVYLEAADGRTTT